MGFSAQDEMSVHRVIGLVAAEAASAGVQLGTYWEGLAFGLRRDLLLRVAEIQPTHPRRDARVLPFNRPAS
jgi:hypothetical protein